MICAGECLAMELPLSAVDNWCRLEPGDVLCMKGVAAKGDLCQDVTMRINKLQQAVSLSIEGAMVSGGLDMIQDRWQCTFELPQVSLNDDLSEADMKVPETHSVCKRRKNQQAPVRNADSLGLAIVEVPETNPSCLTQDNDQHSTEVHGGQSQSNEEGQGHTLENLSEGKIDVDLKEQHSFRNKDMEIEIQQTKSYRKKTSECNPTTEEVENLGFDINDRKRTKCEKRMPYKELYQELFDLDRKVFEELCDDDGQTRKHECLFCGEVFVNFYNLPRHVKHYHKVTISEYMELLRSAPSEREEKISAFWEMAVPDETNNVVISAGDSLSCSFCGQMHDGVLALKYHLKTKHLGEASLAKMSQKCEKQIQKLGSDNETKTQGTNKPQYNCRFCGLKLSFNAARSRHENYYCRQNPGKRKRFVCPRCAKTFMTKSEYDDHKASHELSEPQFVCNICGRLRQTRSSLNQHIRREHLQDMSETYRFECPTCFKKFVAKDKYLRHLSVHEDVRPFICDICGKQFKTKTAVMKHQRHLHENKYPYQCTRCGHGMDKLQYLESHRCGRIRRYQVSTASDIQSSQTEELPDRSVIGHLETLSPKEPLTLGDHSSSERVDTDGAMPIQVEVVSEPDPVYLDMLKTVDYSVDRHVNFMQEYAMSVPLMPPQGSVAQQPGYSEIQPSPAMVHTPTGLAHTYTVGMPLGQYSRMNYVPLYYDQERTHEVAEVAPTNTTVPPDGDEAYKLIDNVMPY